MYFLSVTPERSKSLCVFEPWKLSRVPSDKSEYWIHSSKQNTPSRVIYKCCFQYCVSIVKWYWNNNVFLLIIIVSVSKYFSLSSFWLKTIILFSLVLFFAVVIAVKHKYKQNKTKTKKKKNQTKTKQNNLPCRISS